MATISYRDPGTGDFVPFVTVPVGTIIAYGGSVAPAGWKICNGAAHYSPELEAIFGSPNTPDLRDRFVIGASTTRPLKTTGGLSTVTLSATQSGIPAHNHTAAQGAHGFAHVHSLTFDYNQGGHHHASGYVMDGVVNTTLNVTSTGPDYPIDTTSDFVADSHSHTGTAATANATHSHTVTINSATAQPATASHENRPPYYSLIYIVKV